MMELHLVSDPGGRGAAGPGGLTIVMTEATASWDLSPDLFRLSGGLFWAPFATINRDWLGAQNLFTLVPIASGIFPAHLNETGVRVDGAHVFGPKLGLNYVVSVGNGSENFDISGQGSYDGNHDKTVVGRVGLFPGLDRGLEVGVSWAGGVLREDETVGAPVGDPETYGADFGAWAVDVAYARGPLSIRGYHGGSVENLTRGDRADVALDRVGSVLEGSYELDVSLPLGIRGLTPKVRMDRGGADRMDDLGVPGRFSSRVYSVGLTIRPEYQTHLSVEYHFRREGAHGPLANDRLIVRLSADF